MTRVLFILTGFSFVISLVLFIIGLTSQSAFGFAGALLCGLPVFSFFFGGAFFTLFLRYRFVPKEDETRAAVATNARRRTAEPLA